MARVLADPKAGHECANSSVKPAQLFEVAHDVSGVENAMPQLEDIIYNAHLDCDRCKLA